MNKVSNVHNEESRMEARPAEFVLLGYGCVKHGLKTRATQSFYFMPGALANRVVFNIVAKSFLGLATRIISKIVSLTLAQFVNKFHNHKPIRNL